MAVVGMTDVVWQGGSVTRTLRRGPCRASRHDRGRRVHEGASGDRRGQWQRAVAKTGDEVTAGGPGERQKSIATETRKMKTARADVSERDGNQAGMMLT